ncbi:hypothetical protein KOW79_022014 [Hemibagrus wyckioides]|uniref:Uncharacterized protein n=1 Tax=Hemibagrus wyckioides TaxID=337641 RepID=A0A9D3N1A3_9TELE|nr:hypothetical protein KOW79_022014 [Hemibagrus wyckioides]
MDGLATQSHSSNGSAFDRARREFCRPWTVLKGEGKQHRLSFHARSELRDLLLEMLNRVLGVKKEDFQAPD